MATTKRRQLNATCYFLYCWLVEGTLHILIVHEVLDMKVFGLPLKNDVESMLHTINKQTTFMFAKWRHLLLRADSWSMETSHTARKMMQFASHAAQRKSIWKRLTAENECKWIEHFKSRIEEHHTAENYPAPLRRSIWLWSLTHCRKRYSVLNASYLRVTKVAQY